MALAKFMDLKSSTFDKFPETAADAIEAIVDAVDKYASAVTPPSTAASSAKSAMKAKMQGLGDDEDGQKKMEDGIMEYAKVLATGMAPNTGQAPPAPLNLSPVAKMGENKGESADIAKQISTLVDVYFKTGLAIPPSGPAIPWT